MTSVSPPTATRPAPGALAGIRTARLSDGSVRLLNTLQLVIAGILIMAPTVWMVLSSFKPSFEVTAYPPTLIFTPTLENYVQLTETTPFLSYTLNSIIVTTGSAALGLLFGIPAAFAVSWTRITWPAVLTLAARMAPGTLFLLPWYVMFRQVGMIGSYSALILAHAVITMPIVIWVLLPSFDNIPRSVFEAAQVDGCSVTRILWRIALPLVGSGIAVAAILAFVFSWNYFLFALVLSNGDTKTLIAAAFNFVGEGSTQWGALMAAATLIALPPLALAVVVQRWLVAGLTLGAVKG
jgi:multiple sugar transport system permease protein